MEKTTQEKIDYIYDHIKKEEKMLFWKRFTKFLMYLFFIAYLAYFYFIWFEKLKNTIIDSVKPNINSDKLVEWLKNNSWEIFEKLKKYEILKKFYEKKKAEENNKIIEEY